MAKDICYKINNNLHRVTTRWHESCYEQHWHYQHCGDKITQVHT